MGKNDARLPHRAAAQLGLRLARATATSIMQAGVDQRCWSTVTCLGELGHELLKEEIWRQVLSIVICYFAQNLHSLNCTGCALPDMMYLRAFEARRTNATAKYQFKLHEGSV